ncbi:CC chemokine, partial [Clarias magur]
MHFSQKMRSLVVIAFFACMTLTLAQEKESVCCREVSSKKITVPITGFRVQPERLPCVKAVIFYTSEGAVCSHWRESWVKAKVTELRKLQARDSSSTTFAHLFSSAIEHNTRRKLRNNCNLHFSQKMRGLVVIAFFACMALTLAGFRLQLQRGPCVKAVIFYTSEGAVCSHWKESWVKEKVTELRKLQARDSALAHDLREAEKQLQHAFQPEDERPRCHRLLCLHDSYSSTFYTSEGAVCSHWKESWVKEKVTELRKLQAR